MSLSLTEAAEIGRRLSQVTPTTLDRERMARLEDDLRTLKNQADRIERLLVVLGVNPSTVAQLRGNHDACTLDGLMDWVAHRMGLTKTMLMSPSRQCQIAWARQLAMWLAVRHLKLSTETVGRAFHRDHGTVIHARRKVDREIALSSMLGSEAKKIEGEWLVVMKAKGKQ